MVIKENLKTTEICSKLHMLFIHAIHAIYTSFSCACIFAESMSCGCLLLEV